MNRESVHLKRVYSTKFFEMSMSIRHKIKNDYIISCQPASTKMASQSNRERSFVDEKKRANENEVFFIDKISKLKNSGLMGPTH